MFRWPMMPQDEQALDEVGRAVALQETIRSGCPRGNYYIVSDGLDSVWFLSYYWSRPSRIRSA